MLTPLKNRIFRREIAKHNEVALQNQQQAQLQSTNQQTQQQFQLKQISESEACAFAQIFPQATPIVAATGRSRQPLSSLNKTFHWQKSVQQQQLQQQQNEASNTIQGSLSSSSSSAPQSARLICRNLAQKEGAPETGTAPFKDVNDMNSTCYNSHNRINASDPINSRQTLSNFRISSASQQSSPFGGSPQILRKRRSLGNPVSIFSSTSNKPMFGGRVPCIFSTENWTQILKEEELAQQQQQQQQQSQPLRQQLQQSYLLSNRSPEKQQSNKPICDISILNSMYVNRFSSSGVAASVGIVAESTSCSTPTQKQSIDSMSDTPRMRSTSRSPQKKNIKFIESKRITLATPDQKQHRSTFYNSAQFTFKQQPIQQQQQLQNQKPQSATTNNQLNSSFYHVNSAKRQQPVWNQKQMSNNSEQPSLHFDAQEIGFASVAAAAISADTSANQFQQVHAKGSQDQNPSDFDLNSKKRKEKKSVRQALLNSRGFPYIIQFNEGIRPSTTPFFDNSPLESWAGATEESTLQTINTDEQTHI